MALQPLFISGWEQLSAYTANYCFDKDVDGGIRTHTELFTEFIKLCFLLVVHTDRHCCLCHKSKMFV